MMNAETWMTAQESVDNGLADSLLDPDESDDDNADVAANFDLSHFRKVPRQIAERCTRDGGSEWRRRVLRQHTLELHQLDLDSMHRETLALHDREIREWRLAE